MADEYISREAAKAILKWHEHRFTCADEANGFGSVKWSEYVIYADTAQNCIDAIPAADVVKVVRCKDCRMSEPCADERECYCTLTHAYKPTEYFCADGEMDEEVSDDE